MTRSLLCIALAMAVPVHLSAQSTGDFYELGNYDYFGEPAVGPAPEPSTLVTPSAPFEEATPSPVAGDVGPASTGSAPVSSDTARGTPPKYPTGDLAAAREAAKALGKPARAGAAGLPTGTDLTATIPHYTTGSLPQETYADDPDGLDASGAAAALSSDAWRFVTNPDRTRVTLGEGELARGKAIEADPNAYVDGEALDGSPGRCEALPPATTGAGFYEATCNEGTRLDQGPRSCRIPLIVEATAPTTSWQYQCESYFSKDRSNAGRLCFRFDSSVASGVCTVTNVALVPGECLQHGPRGGCFEPGEPIEVRTLSCSAPVPNVSGGSQITVPGTITERRDESQCASVVGGATCQQTTETCVDSEPQTRTVNGVEVTKACWAWERTFSCSGTSQATDCGELSSNASCAFEREECLDDPQTGACQLLEKVYRCPVPAEEGTGVKQYVCGGDVYCINGDCEPIEREASTEFKDALVGLHALGQASDEFDETTLTLFSGTRDTCHKKLFGTLNCCSGKGLPVLTPAFCSAAEKQLDERDRKGLCHSVGSYCSDKVLGVCVTSKRAYCCFESELSRILQEQGRPQIGKKWASPKTEQCKGFSIDEFAQLDLSVMDFTEVYAKFVDAAKLPDELQTATAIQDRIQLYFEEHKAR